MKQTALDYFMQSLGITKTSKFEITDTDGSPKIIHVSEVYEQAKAMEKEQIIESYCIGCADITKDNNIFPRETSEQYYNETFKSE